MRSLAIRCVVMAVVLTSGLAFADSGSGSGSGSGSACGSGSGSDPESVVKTPPQLTLADRTTGMCIDQEIADRLAIKRKRRGAVDRLFVKQGRHEISIMGGYYDSDLLSGTYVLSAAYTYHMTDQTAVEFTGSYTHANADIVRALEDGRGTVLADTYATVYFGESVLQWSPIYGKLRLGGEVVHFDMHADIGVGVVDSGTSRGAAGVAGFGIKLFAGQWAAIRFDVRDRTYRQELLDEHFLVNDIAVTAGFSVFLPFHN
jgi:outer membrane beta-barrel protein